MTPQPLIHTQRQDMTTTQAAAMLDRCYDLLRRRGFYPVTERGDEIDGLSFGEGAGRAEIYWDAQDGCPHGWCWLAGIEGQPLDNINDLIQAISYSKDAQRLAQEQEEAQRLALEQEEEELSYAEWEDSW